MIRPLLAVLAAAALVAPALAEPTAPAPAPAPAGALLGPALNVSDVDRSLRFYVDGLGMKLATRRPGPKRVESILTFGGPDTSTLLLLSDAAGAHPAIEQGNGFDKLVMRMASLDATVARLKAAGFATGEVHEAAGGMVRVLHATDPDGYHLELVEMRGKPGAAR
ncbi:MAG: VOC family protein [Sphingomonadales bacterium]|nr:VOC family protein [Sphingomonadales bacterium]